jgi:hypothetical protein
MSRNYAALFTSLLILLSISTCHSQHSYGFRLGADASTLNVSNDEVGHFSAMIYGPVAGVVVSMPLASDIVLQGELLFATKGQWEKVSFPYAKGYSCKERIHYLELPFSLYVDLGKNKSRGLFIPVGIYFGLGVGGSSTYVDDASGHKEKGDVVFVKRTDPSSNPRDFFVKRTDYGCNFGLGYKFKKVAVDFTYNIGLKDIHPPEDKNDKLSVKNLYLRLAASYYFTNEE